MKIAISALAARLSALATEGQESLEKSRSKGRLIKPTIKMWDRIDGARKKINDFNDGRMAEWFKAAVLKTAVGASPP